MKLDATALRYLTPEEFRVLTAVEMGSKNHHVVPTQLIAQISGLRSGGVNKILGELLKRKLVGREGGKDDGFRLAYGGYDYLAIRSMSKRDTVVSVGNQIGTGKESDVYVVADAEGEERVLKIHRLGRVSFRSIKTKRDYLRKGQSAGNWMYLSRLAATKEYAFMKVLHAHGFPVPEPFDHSRHCLLMSLIPSFPLRQVANIPEDEVPVLYSKLMDLIVRLANCGLIHGDFNEFNLLVKEKEDGGVDPILIDFPQMVSTEHENAEFYFNRDVECIRKFFRKRFNYESNVWLRFSTILKEGKREFELDVEVEASGWKGGKEGKVLEDVRYHSLSLISN
ncbi:RIO1-domain-containing protein [Atractiella rhizophila]|nr:RIO1-domain-containing protein [Atractiella rhizophila]